MRTIQVLWMVACVTVLILLNSSLPVNAQCCESVCPPYELPMITLSDGTELELFVDETRWGSFINLTSDAFSIHMNRGGYGVEPISFRTSNTDNTMTHGWQEGERIVDLTGRWPSELEDGIVDASFLPPSYAALWERLRSTCAELVDSEEFWKLASFEHTEIADEFREAMERMRDGYYPPSASCRLLHISFEVAPAAGMIEVSTRGYRIVGPTVVRLLTPSAYDDPDPEIHLQIIRVGLLGNWYIRMNPEERTAEITWDALHAAVPMYPEEWAHVIEIVRETLLMARGYIPLLTQDGLLGPEDDLEFLIDRTLEGLSEYEFEAAYTDNFWDYPL